jgi:hypothetical protein
VKILYLRTHHSIAKESYNWKSILNICKHHASMFLKTFGDTSDCFSGPEIEPNA